MGKICKPVKRVVGAITSTPKLPQTKFGPLTDAEKKVINKWTRDWKDMRNADLLGLPNKDLAVMRSAIAKSPRTRQVIERGLILDAKTAEVLSQGKYFDNLAMSSYTTDAEKFLAGKVQTGKSFIKIKGNMSAIDISDHSAFEQPEFLVDKGTRLQIKSRKEITVEGIKGWEVEVEERVESRFRTKKEWLNWIESRTTGKYRTDNDIKEGIGYFGKNGWDAITAYQRGIPTIDDWTRNKRKISADAMQLAYDKIPLHKGTIHRGMFLQDSAKETWTTEGNEFELSSWTSFSKKTKVAAQYKESSSKGMKEGGGYIVHLDTTIGFDIQDVAVYPEEAEVLLPKGAKVRVKQIIGNDIYLEEIQSIKSSIDLSKVEVPKVELPKIESPKIESPKIESPKTQIQGVYKIPETVTGFTQQEWDDFVLNKMSEKQRKKQRLL